MSIRKSIFIFLAVLASAPVEAQRFTLTGRVLDEEQHPIELATVSCLAQGAVTAANLKGEFTLQLSSADSVVIRFSMVGYQTRIRVLRNPRGRQRLIVTLHPMKALDEVVVTERRRQTTGTEQLDTKDIRNTPSTSGNAVEELIQQQAGVSTHNELSSQYNVRGGSFDENAVYINDIEVYRPLLIRSGQQEGLSVINPDMVERIGFSSGGFEAKYGDKMSSTLSITYRRPTRFEANATASLLGCNAFVGYGNKTFSMSHSIRYKTNRNLLNSLDTNGEYKPRFLDYQTFVTWQPNPRWSMELLGNIAENHYKFLPSDRETTFGTMENAKSFKVYFDGQEKDVFRTFFATASLARHFSQTTAVRLLGSTFHTKEQETYDIQGQYWLDDAQTTESLGVGTYMEHARNYLTADVSSLKLQLSHKQGGHDLETAVTYKREHIVENAREYEMRDSSGYSIPHTGDRLDLIYSLNARHDISSNRWEAYLMDNFRCSSGDGERQTFYTLNAGARISYWSYTQETLFSPRLSLAIIPAANPDMTIRLATGLYYQAPFYKELRDTTTINGVTTVTLNNKIKSQRSIHFVGAMDYRFKIQERPFKFTAELYYKLLGNLIPYNINNLKVTYVGENLASGHIAGLDLKLYGEFVSGTDSWLTLSLMNTRQKINGESVPLPTDQRYAVNLHFTDYFPGTTRWLMTLKLAFADGLPFGAPHRGLGQQNFRAPAYKRADIGMSYLAYDNNDRSRPSVFRRIWLGADCLNLLGVSNVNSYYWVNDVSNCQYAVPNYLTGRQINGKLTVEF